MPVPHMQHSSMSLAMEQPIHTVQHKVNQPGWERERSQETPIICIWSDSWSHSHKLRSHRSTQSGPSGTQKTGIGPVGWSQPWWQTRPGEWRHVLCCICSTTRSDWWRFESYQRTEVKYLVKKGWRSSPGSQTQSDWQSQGSWGFIDGVDRVLP